MVEDLVEIPSEKIDAYTAEELETVQYLEYCINSSDEKGMLARFIWQQIAFGRISAHDVAVVLGAYDPEGIQLDEGATFDGWSADPVEIEYDEDETTLEAGAEDAAALPPSATADDGIVESAEQTEENAPPKE